MTLAVALRALTRLNPSTRGRGLTQLVAERLGQPPQPGVYEIWPGVRMELQMRAPLERALFFRNYEIRSTRALERALPRDGVFVDIGANIGFYTLVAAHRLRGGRGGRVIAFEPNPTTLPRLRRNLALNDAAHVEVNAVALGDEDGVLPLYMPADACHGETSLRPQGWAGETVVFDVPVRRLDDVLPADLARIDLLKIDVEGAELLAFRGGEAALRTYRPTVLMEINPVASAAFGLGPYDALDHLLDLVPGYSLELVDTHRVSPVTRAELGRRRLVSANLLLRPARPRP